MTMNIKVIELELLVLPLPLLVHSIEISVANSGRGGAYKLLATWLLLYVAKRMRDRLIMNMWSSKEWKRKSSDSG